MKLGSKIKHLRLIMVAGACLMLIFILAVSYMQTDHEKKFMEELTFLCDVGGKNVELKPWRDEEQGIYYLVLPSCFSKENTDFVLKYNENAGELSFDGKAFRSGDVWGNIENEAYYQLKVTGLWGKVYVEAPMQVLVSEKLPAVMVSVEAEELLSLEDFENKKYIETGDMLILDEEGHAVFQEKLERFKIRGNLTAGLDKKPFTFVLDEPQELFGMEAALKWNLLANATDTSYIRNKVVLDMANVCIDAYEPEGEFVELFLNGEYRGIYLLTEAVNIEENRLNISYQNDWFLEMELDFRLEEGTPYVITEQGQIFVIHSEEVVTDAQKQQVKELLDDIESALYAEDGVSKISGRTLEELIDLESFAEAWLIQEISGDHDTGIASQFVYTSGQNNLLYAGPVWDYDGSMGNVNTAMFRIPESLTTVVSKTRVEGNANQNRWLSAMYQSEKFREILERKYKDVFSPYLEELCSTKLDAYEDQICRAAILDALRWHESRLSWSFVLPEGIHVTDEGEYYRFDTLGCSIDMVREFLARKKNFLDRLWIEHREYCVVEIRNDAPFLNADYNQTMYYWVEKDTAIEDMPLIEADGYEFCGYIDRANGEIVTNGTVIQENCILDGKWEQAGEDN